MGSPDQIFGRVDESGGFDGKAPRPFIEVRGDFSALPEISVIKTCLGDYPKFAGHVIRNLRHSRALMNVEDVDATPRRDVECFFRGPGNSWRRMAPGLLYHNGI